MPTYEYVCKHCDHQFEEFQLITAKPLKKCPECGKLKLQRLIGSGSGLLFKGSGFYQTDYRSEGYQKAAKTEKETVSGSKSVKDKKETPVKTKEKAPSADSAASKSST